MLWQSRTNGVIAIALVAFSITFCEICKSRRDLHHISSLDHLHSTGGAVDDEVGSDQKIDFENAGLKTVGNSILKKFAGKTHSMSQIDSRYAFDSANAPLNAKGKSSFKKFAEKMHPVSQIGSHYASDFPNASLNAKGKPPFVNSGDNVNLNQTSVHQNATASSKSGLSSEKRFSERVSLHIDDASHLDDASYLQVFTHRLSWLFEAATCNLQLKHYIENLYVPCVTMVVLGIVVIVLVWLAYYLTRGHLDDSVHPKARSEEKSLPKERQKTSLSSKGCAHAVSYKESEFWSGKGSCGTFRWMSMPEVAELDLAFEEDPAHMSGTEGRFAEHARHAIAGGGSADLIPAPWSEESVRKALRGAGIDTSAWVDSKVQQLFQELVDGSAFLVVTPTGVMRRVVSYVLVVVFHPLTGRVIVPYKQGSRSSQFKRASEASKEMPAQEATLSIRKHHMETIEEAADRCIRTKLSASDRLIQVTEGLVKTTESEEVSTFYPGLTTMVRRHMIQARVVATDRDLLKSIGADLHPGADHSFATEYQGLSLRWLWQAPEKIPDFKQHCTWLSKRGYLSRSMGISIQNASTGKSSSGSGRRSTVSSSRIEQKDLCIDSLRLVLPWNPSTVRSLLDAYQVTADEFGMTLEKLSSEASQGMLIFGVRGVDGKLVTITDHILLQIRYPETQMVLVQTDESDEGLIRARFPASTWRIDQGCCDAARHLVQSQLPFDEEQMTLSSKIREVQPMPQNCNVPDDSERRLNRQWMLTASISD